MNQQAWCSQLSGKTEHIHSYCKFIWLLSRWWFTSRHVLYGGYFSAWSPAYFRGYLPGSTLYPISRGKDNHLFNRTHPLHPAPLALCGCAVRFSCSITKLGLCFHFKKVEAKGIVSILLQLQESFLKKLQERSYWLTIFLSLAIDIFMLFLCLVAEKCLHLFIWLMVWFLFLYL